MTRGTYEGLKTLRPDERPFVLTRATYAGGQRYAAQWPGDNVSDWTAMRGAIPTLLGMGLSGLSFVGVDVGGFAEAPTPELYTRWLQSGLLYPFYRTHTTFGTPDQEPWSYGLQWEAYNRRAIEMRYELLPEIYNVMHDTTVTGLPAMRPLVLEYPDDPATYGLDDQYMFGADLMLAPVLREGATTRSVYLPKGGWIEVAHRPLVRRRRRHQPAGHDGLDSALRARGCIHLPPARRAAHRPDARPAADCRGLRGRIWHRFALRRRRVELQVRAGPGDDAEVHADARRWQCLDLRRGR